MEGHLKINSVNSGCEKSTHNSSQFVCVESEEDLLSSPSSLSLNNDLVSLSPESNFKSFQSTICSNDQLMAIQYDFSHCMNTTIPCENRRSAFVGWRRNRVSLLHPKNSQNLHKCCFSFLNHINSQKSLSFHTNNGGNAKDGRIDKKLAARHAAAERRRRDEMKNIYFALRSLLPVNSRKSKAAVLLQILDFVKQLKRGVEMLEKRNAELEHLLRIHAIANDSIEFV